MKLSEMKKKIAEVEEIESEISFLSRISVVGIYSMNIKPNHSSPMFIPNDMIEGFLGEAVMTAIVTRIEKREQMRKALLNQLGVTSE